MANRTSSRPSTALLAAIITTAVVLVVGVILFATTRGTTSSGSSGGNDWVSAVSTDVKVAPVAHGSSAPLGTQVVTHGNASEGWRHRHRAVRRRLLHLRRSLRLVVVPWSGGAVLLERRDSRIRARHHRHAARWSPSDRDPRRPRLRRCWQSSCSCPQRKPRLHRRPRLDSLATTATSCSVA